MAALAHPTRFYTMKLQRIGHDQRRHNAFSGFTLSKALKDPNCLTTAMDPFEESSGNAVPEQIILFTSIIFSLR
jgi:hypothetical protein